MSLRNFCPLLKLTYGVDNIFGVPQGCFLGPDFFFKVWDEKNQGTSVKFFDVSNSLDITAEINNIFPVKSWVFW